MKVLVVCGATASGKTKLAVDCALKLDTEVISADSQLIYKGLNIGTAKPSMEERRGIKHHMIDVIEPDESFSVSEYAAQAEPVIDNLLNKGKVPIVCGGTGFYINSLLFDLSYGNAAADISIREKYNEILLEEVVSTAELDADSVETNPYAKADNTGAGVAFLFKNDVRKLSLENPMPFYQYPLQVEKLETIIPCEARTAGVIVYYPLSALIAVGVS